MTPPLEIIIIGGGCAGLSLAMRLSKLYAKKTVLIVESRSTYHNDRTWCFWGHDSAQLRHLVSHRWHSVLLQAPGRIVRFDCRTAPYEMISAETFYSAAQREISQNPCIELLTGTALTSEPWRDDGLWHLETTAGRHAARILIDTRPNLPVQPGEAVLWQSFLGQEIECDGSVFAPATATLMKFMPIEDGRISFVYVLPFSRKRALVEFTVFSPVPLGADELSQGLERGITAEVGAAGYSVIRTEHGILPMGLTKPAPEAQPTSVCVGVSSGGARPSSGFAFQRIQRWARACAEALLAGGAPVAHIRDSWSLAAMDDLFLRVLRARPELSPHLYLSLFEIKNGPGLIRFMSDKPSLADCASIALSLPAWPFLAEIPDFMLGRSCKNSGGPGK